MRVLVTGATGFIGGRIVAQLRARNDEVLALVRSPAKACALEELGVTIVPGDITDRKSVSHAVRDVDAVFHAAAWYKLGIPDVEMAEAVNVGGARHVLECAVEARVARIVYTSTLAVFSDTRGETVDETYRFIGRHQSQYDRTKAIAFHELAEPMMRAGAPLTVVLPGVAYGPGDSSPVGKAFERYARGKLRTIPSRTAYCWGHVDDMAAAHLAALDHGEPGQSYIVAGPPHRLDEAFAIAERITGIRAPLRIPAALLRVAASCLQPISALVSLPPALHPETLRVLAGVTYLGDSSKARECWGFAPRSLEDGLRTVLRGKRTA